MIVLIVDDQMTVLNGLLKGIHFTELGVDMVLTATNTIEAKDVINNKKVDIILSDIEMPGENGIELIKWVAKYHPDIIRILLTSHANFTYAKESIQSGCFDYIVQPAPYPEIEETLERAIAKYYQDQKKEQYYLDGLFFNAHKPELSDRTVLNLYSHNPRNKQESVNLLNQMGYPITEETAILLMTLDIYPLATSTDPAFFDLTIRKHIHTSLNVCQFTPPVYFLMTLNPYKQFVILLFCNDNTFNHYDKRVFNNFYEDIKKRICPEISCYIGVQSTFPELRKEVHQLDMYIKNNVNKKIGLYFLDQRKPSEEYLTIADNFSHWERLLNSEQFEPLQKSILSYIDFISTINKTNLKTLCDLHQQLTQLFFTYAYQHDIEVVDLLTGEYSYNDYMDGFKSTQALRESVNYIIPIISSHVETDSQNNAVQRAKKYILNNISQNLSVKDVADYVHLSPEYFTKLFKKEIGQNIKTYILQFKVDVAKDLLRNQNIPISVVALDLGFSNFSHFTQIFKKFENVTPTEYRNNLLEKSRA